MKSLFALATLALGCCLALQSASADGIHRNNHAIPTCEPGFQIVTEVVMQEVTRTVCKTVPETKKKWVYSWVDDPFCIQCSKHGSCENCDGPYCRKQLVKWQVDECTPHTKCVTETIKELVPLTVYRKVPCAAPEAKIDTPPVAPKLGAK